MGNQQSNQNQFKHHTYNEESIENVLSIDNYKPMPNDFKAYVGVDFGTHGTGLAYALHTGEVYVHQKWKGYKRCAEIKPKTCILLDAKGKFLAFGQPAINSYITMGGDKTGWLLFENFKMALYKDSGLTQLTAVNGKKIRMERVFVEALKYIKIQLFKFFVTNKLQIDTIDDIQWILTVPSIWSEKAKNTMEQCAYKAGLISKKIANHLKIVYEPDCASFSLQCEVQRLAQQKQTSTHYLNQAWTKRARYILIDAGGGTCDVACHQMLDVFAVEEIVHPSGGPWGSIYIDDHFIQLLHTIFKKEWVEEFKRDDPASFTELIDNFRDSKHEFWNSNSERKGTVDLGSMSLQNKLTLFADKWHSTQLPFDFCTFLHIKAQEEGTELETIVGNVEICDCGISGLLQLEDEYLKLNYLVWTTQLFDPVIEPIIKHCKHLLSETTMKNTTNYVCLVGGLSSSKYLQHRISTTFGPTSRYGLKIIIPTRPILSVVDGAARFGLRPNYIQARTLSKTYGQSYDPTMDAIDIETLPAGYLENNQYVCEYAQVLRVRNIFSVYAHKNQRVNINDKPIVRRYKRVNVKEKKVEICIYCSDEQDPKIAVKPCLAKCVIVFPPNSTELSVIVEVYFSDTKIRVFAYPVDNVENKTEMVLDYETGYQDSKQNEDPESKETTTPIDNDTDVMVEQMLTLQLGSKEMCRDACQAVDYININAAIEWALSGGKKGGIKKKKEGINSKFTAQQSTEKQFYSFLERMNMQKYFDQFKENECCDMDSIGLFDDDILMNDVGIKSKIVRKKFLKHCDGMKHEIVRFKSQNVLSSVLYDKLAKYGVVTPQILCEQVICKNDLKNKFEITNENQVDIIWNIVTKETNLMTNNVANEGGNNLDDDTVYIAY